MPEHIAVPPHFASARPARGLEAVDKFRREAAVRSCAIGVVEGSEMRECKSDGETCVCDLEWCCQAKFAAGDRRVMGDDGQSSGYAVGALLKDGERGRWLRYCKARRIRFHDARFMPGYLFNGVPKKGGMIDAEACDAAGCWRVYNVCAVVLSANAAFNDCRVDPFADIGMEGHEGKVTKVDWFSGCVGGFALSSRLALQSIPHLKEVLGKSLLRERLIVDLDAFTNETEVWGCVQADLFEKGLWLRGRGQILGQYP